MDAPPSAYTAIAEALEPGVHEFLVFVWKHHVIELIAASRAINLPANDQKPSPGRLEWLGMALCIQFKA